MTDVVTVTPNPAVDQTLWIPGFRAGEVNRVEREEVVAGGKGVNVAAFLAAFGCAVHATGFLGIPNAAIFEAFLETAEIDEGFVRVGGATRTGIKIADQTGGLTTDVNFPGFEVGLEDVVALQGAVAAESAPGRWVVLAGSLPRGAPADLYRRLTDQVHDHGGLVALDSSGEALAAAIEAGPDLVKPNRDELAELVGRPLEDRDALLGAAQELLGRDIATVVVSLGADGALFVRESEAVFAAAAPVDVASTVGAGDAMIAGTIAAQLQDASLDATARLATAFSAAAVSRIGAWLDPAQVRETAAAVAVEALTGGRA